jgi:hypothetical protein
MVVVFQEMGEARSEWDGDGKVRDKSRKRGVSEFYD